MRPLPRLHAVTDSRILARTDLLELAARLVDAAGPALAIHVRDRALPARQLLAHAQALGRITGPGESALVINARADVAAAVDAQGLHLGQGDLTPGEARRVLGTEWHGAIGVSVHDAAETAAALAAGADYLMLGNIYPTTSHPGRPGLGVAVLHTIARCGRPVVAVGGIGPEQASAVREAGAWGVAALRALWDAPDPAAAAAALLQPWANAA